MTQKIQTPDRIDIFGTKFSNVDIDLAVGFLTNNQFNQPGYVCFPSTSSVSRAYKNTDFQNILNNSLLTVADGKFTEYYARAKGHKPIKNISGYWLLERLLDTNLKHFFYGCDDETLEKLKSNIEARFPNANVLGYMAPPFVEVGEIKNNPQIIKDFAKINNLKPDLIWIGISGLKQDHMMYNYKNNLDQGIMLGVGAVFLYHAGVIKKGPEILKKLALRWVYRIIQEPVRILKKNVAIPGIFGFIFLILKHDFLKIKTKKPH